MRRRRWGYTQYFKLKYTPVSLCGVVELPLSLPLPLSPIESTRLAWPRLDTARHLK